MSLHHSCHSRGCSGPVLMSWLAQFLHFFPDPYPSQSVRQNCKPISLSLILSGYVMQFFCPVCTVLFSRDEWSWGLSNWLLETMIHHIGPNRSHSVRKHSQVKVSSWLVVTVCQDTEKDVSLALAAANTSFCCKSHDHGCCCYSKR